MSAQTDAKGAQSPANFVEAPGSRAASSAGRGSILNAQNKGKLVILNAFSANMVLQQATVRFSRISLDVARELVQKYKDNLVSFIGHEGTSKLLSQVLGTTIAFNRAEYKLSPGDVLLIFSLNRRLLEPTADIANISLNDIIVTLAEVIA